LARIPEEVREKPKEPLPTPPPLLVAAALLGALLSAPGAAAHGKLTVPAPRDGKVARAGLDENNPVPLTSDDFVCRYANRNPAVPITPVQAGGRLTLTWSFTAAHVGDCAAFVSYDVDLPRRDQRYVKIANFPDCKAQNMQPVQIDVPAILPAGRAILRWDWPATHIYPTIEWFVTCADIEITASPTSSSFNTFDSFSIVNPPIYPSDGNSGVGFWNPWGGGGERYMTGPACVDPSLNNCALTAPGTPGYTGLGGNSATSGATPGAIPAPSPATPSPMPAPTPPAMSPTEYSPAPMPAPQPMPAPAPVPGPMPAPVPAPSGSCISNGPDYYTATCAALEATCEQFSFCKRASALAQSSALHPSPRVVHQHKFLHRQDASGNILLQTGTRFETGLQPNLASGFEDEEL